MQDSKLLHNFRKAKYMLETFAPKSYAKDKKPKKKKKQQSIIQYKNYLSRIVEQLE